MKYLLTIIMVSSSFCYAQCTNVFGKRVKCPEFNDSLALYNNAVKVNGFFERSDIYKRTRSIVLKTNFEKKEIYVTLQKARNVFNIIRSDSSLSGENDPLLIRPKSGYVDISINQYYQEIDENRFYQRELENQIINSESPMPMYDYRITPVVVNEYKCIDTSSIFYGDIVNIPLYIPVVVKPVSMLSETEMALRQKVVHFKSNDLYALVEDETMADRYKATYANLEVPISKRGLPVFMYNNYGSGSIIGFIADGEFVRLRPEEYDTYVVQDFARNLLANEADLVKYIVIRYGGFFSVVK